ncbi:MAG: penicillin-binding transpeptidase domain-containing protein, partial [Limosilactobacillus fermentum]
SGKVVKRKNKLTTKRIISKKVANTMTSMMIGVFKHGTGKNAAPSGYTIAGKTGTTNSGLTNDDNDRDKWIIGYTPDVVVVTWEGYDTTTKTNQLYDVENNDIYGLFKTEMSGILSNTAGTKFTVQDAQTKAQEAAKSASSSNSSGSNLWNRVSDFANNVNQQVQNAWSNIRSLF